MKIFNYTQPKMIIADEGKRFRDINDLYVADQINPETEEVIKGHEPYYFTTLFVPDNFDFNKINELYVEE